MGYWGTIYSLTGVLFTELACNLLRLMPQPRVITEEKGE